MKTKTWRMVQIALIAALLLIAGCGQENIDSFGGVGGTGGTTGNPASIAVSLLPTTVGDPPIPTYTTTVTATVRDAFNNLVSGATVDFNVNNAAAGAFSAASATTNASGVATVTFTANSGVNLIVTITASVTPATGSPINNSAALTINNPPAPTPANINMTINPLSVTIQNSSTVSITVTDSNGNPAFSTNISLTITSGAALGSFNALSDVDTITVTTDGSGQASATFYAGGTSGVATITAQWTSPTPPVPPNVTKSATLSITSVPSNINLTAIPWALTVGGTAQIKAVVTNILGTAVPDGTVVTFSIFAGPANPGTLTATASTVTDPVTGEAIASATFNASTTVTGNTIIQAVAGTAPNEVSATVLIQVQAAQTASIQFVSASPDIIGIAGSGVTSTSYVKFKVKDSNGNPPAQSVAVDFQLYGPTGAYLGAVPGSLTDTQTTSTVDATRGEVTVILNAGDVPGPARIVATVQGTTISTSSGNISIGGGVPSHTHFDLAATKVNLEGLAYNNIQTTITAYLADRFGNYNVLQGTSVSFFTEGGAIDTSNTTDITGIASVTLRTQAPTPIDVDPDPSWSEDSYTYGGRTYNPRDGWVSVLVSTTGEETFFDANANGIRDAGEAYTDLAEPFIDTNDDGSRDDGTTDPAELYFDWPPGMTGSTIGSYDNPNLQWDSQIPIFKTYTLVFTGGPDFTDTTEYNNGKRTSRIECATATPAPLGDVTIAAGGSKTFTVYVSDINMNTLIKDTKIDVALVTGSAGTLIAPSLTLADGLSWGPTSFTITLTNDGAGSAQIELTVNWKGTDYKYYYPGTITLL